MASEPSRKRRTPLVTELQKPSLTANTPVSGEFPITLNVNGTERTIYIEPRVTLLDALRERLGFTGTKKGCNHGQCGACTVLVNGQRINSCLTLAVMQVDQAITTIEGFANGNELHPVQAAFIEHDAFQCGYCTSGQICSAIGLLNEGHAQTDAEIQELMSGNLCRCGAYVSILAAIQEARVQMGTEPSSQSVKACYPPVISFNT